MMRQSIMKICGGILVGVIALAGCSDTTKGSTSSDPTTSASAAGQEITTPPSFQDGSFSGPAGINAIASLADAAVLAEILDIGSPHFNSIDGKPWGLTPEEQLKDLRTTPSVWRDATIRVTKVIYSNGKVSAVAGEELKLRVYGDGAVDPGDQVVRILSDGTELYHDRYDAMIQEGSSVLLLLYQEEAPIHGGGSESYVRTALAYQGSWRIEGDMAVNIDPARTAPLAELLRRILYERSLGRVPGRDAGTELNPLAGEAPPDDWRPPEAAIPSPGALIPAPAGATGAANAATRP